VDGPAAAALGVPYAAWTAFGSALDEEVWRRNRGRMASAPTEAPSSARRSPRSGRHDATTADGSRLPSPHVQ
jgi:hypothetical protein